MYCFLTGAVNSPQILMLSGIGPQDHLSEIGIKTIQDLKVGQNLQDHVGLGGFTFLINKPISIVQASSMREAHAIYFSKLE